MKNIDKEKIIKALETVYDPEFPLLDIYNMWLIYNIDIDEKNKKIHILMTFTSPMCPMWDMIVDMVKNAVNEVYPDIETEVEITFEPQRNPSMIKNEEIKRMFEE